MSRQTPLPIDSILVGQKGSYHILDLIDRGGFGITYRAETVDGDPDVPPMVAIKEFFPKDLCERLPGQVELLITDPNQIEMIGRLRDRFVKESRNLAACDTPSVVRVIDTIEANGTAYMVMELVEGVTLKEYMSQRGDRPLDVDTARRLIVRTAEALEYLHAKKINHLDIKPGNIMVSPDLSRLVVIDFGLSRQYKADGSSDSEIVAAVSKGFASPEQYAGISRFSPESDVYSLGATYYKLITGQTPPEPFDIADDPSVLSIPLSVPYRDRQTIIDAMSPDRHSRLSTAREFINSLYGDNDNDEDDDAKVRSTSAFGIVLNLLMVGIIVLAGFVTADVFARTIAYEFGFLSDVYEVSREGFLFCMGAGVLCEVIGLICRRTSSKLFWMICGAALIIIQTYFAI